MREPRTALEAGPRSKSGGRSEPLSVIKIHGDSHGLDSPSNARHTCMRCGQCRDCKGFMVQCFRIVSAVVVSFGLSTPAFANPVARGLPAQALQPADVAVEVETGPAPAEPQPAPPQPYAQPYAGPAPQPYYDQPGPQPYYGPPGPQPYQEPPQPPKRRKGMMIAGWSLLAGSYIFTAVVGAVISDAKSLCGDPERCRRLGNYMLIPVAGPFMAIGPSQTATGSATLGFVGLVQTAGLIMGIAGTVMFVADGKAHRQAFNRDGLRLGKRLRLQAGPTYDGASMGLRYRF